MQQKTPEPVPPPEFQAEKIEKMGATELSELLKKPGATEFEKAKACQRLGIVGDESAAAALEPLLADPKLSHYARYGLEPLPGTAADDALRNALAKTKGAVLIGVVNSIAKRRDQKAVPALTRMVSGADVELAKAAAFALGHISGDTAMKSLEGALARTKGPVRDAVAAASLVCAEGLLAAGSRTEALSLYTTLSAATTPKPVRLAAMRAIIAQETSLTRPR